MLKHINCMQKEHDWIPTWTNQLQKDILTQLLFSHSVVSFLCDPMDCSTPGFPSLTISWSLLRLTSVESVMPSNHLILCRPLFLMHSIFLSITVFSNEPDLPIRWPKYWSYSIRPSSDYSGLIFLRID